MATTQQKLADSLEILEGLQNQGIIAVRSSHLSRTHRERLLKNGFLQEVMKGWYIPATPGAAAGESTAWYSSFWAFSAAYLNERFGTQWCLSAEQSLFLHAGTNNVPQQLLVRAPRGRNRGTTLVHNTSLFELRTALPSASNTEVQNGLRIYTLPASLVFSGLGLFTENTIEAQTALAMIADPSDVLEILLDGGHSTIAGRLAGAFRNIGRDTFADAIISTMKSAGYDARENNPFDKPAPFEISQREPSPYVMRMKLLWHEMRQHIPSHFPNKPVEKVNVKAYLDHVEDVYITDAYHSLSIEGYRVSRQLIERVRSGEWDPDNKNDDREHKDALAARGYFQAFELVKKSIRKVLDGENPGTVARTDHADWYRELFAPSVTAGIIKTTDLAGYRSGPVYIRGSLHAPPPREAVRDLMPLLFELLAEEEHPAVRVVLGHFLFVYIHPYFDGNGRMGRFLMNVMLASGGYPWTVIPVDHRKTYMDTLEAASAGADITPFAGFLGKLVEINTNGNARTEIPKN